MITAILLAAGQSKRLFNQNKLIKNYKGKPLINHAVQSIIKSKIEKLIIVLGFEYLKVKKKINKNKKIKFVINHNYKRGISSYIKCGLKKISNKSYGFIIVQADMPKISKNILNKLYKEIKTNKKEIFVPIKNNKIGNPIGFKLSMVNQLKKISGNRGAKFIIKRNKSKIKYIRAKSLGIFRDIDLNKDFNS
jgi:molybdenum cofactor cytidylyltransferase